MAVELSILDKYKGESLFANDPDVQASQIDIATDILKFCVAAAEIFFNDQGNERNSLLFAVRAQWRDFVAKFGDIKKDFQRHLAELEKWRSLANARWLRLVQKGVVGVGRSVDRFHRELKEVAEQKMESDNRIAIGKFHSDLPSIALVQLCQWR